MNNDLKDVILQTLEDLGQDEEEFVIEENTTTSKTDDKFLLKLREKILVLFEGLQSPNINNLDKKLDLTINFLEYTLSQIDEKLQSK